MHIVVISLFPEMFDPIKTLGVVGRAFQKNHATLSIINPRDFTQDAHNSVDDRPYGGGAGMVMLAEPIFLAIEEAKKRVEHQAKVYYLAPQGKTFVHKKAQALSQEESFILLCGRYEGVDQRVIDAYVDDSISIGDYVLSGGEVAAMAVIDAVVRLIPGTLGHADSAQKESFSQNLLEHPHYTRPTCWQGTEVPSVLLSGNHENIALWRRTCSEELTTRFRPDLINRGV